MVEIREGYGYIAEIRALFAEYTAMLLSIDPSFGIYLELQHYDEEEKDPGLKYARPMGRLYAAFTDGIPSGCIALRSFDGERAELKRLFVRPEARGRGIGSMLLRRVVEDAEEIGYRSILLDTLPQLPEAIALYRRFGFEETERYNDSPQDGTVFMRLRLSQN